MNNSILPYFFLVVFLSPACNQNEPVVKNVFPENWIDLSYAYDSSTIYWPTAEGFKLDTAFEGHTKGGYYYSAFNFSSAEHGGTHLDAPIHFAEGMKTSDEIDLEQLVGEAVVVDVSENALKNKDYLISAEDFQDWEEKYDELPENIIILIRTGYGQFWPDAEQYMGTAERGPDAVAKLHFPGISPEAAQWLVDNRKIKAIGIDTPSIDFGQSKDFKAHRILFKENIPAFENVANLDKLPLSGIYVVALPMKIKGGSGGPLRVIASILN
ncbi:MAG: cyclase family protein [Bacteroidota bacterium]